MDEEIWRDIPNYEGRYQASSLGRIRSLARKHKRATSILNPVLHRDGYAKVNLKIGRKSRTFHVHVLVAWVFRGPRPDGMYVDHENLDHGDNRACNLKYKTPTESNYNVRKPQESPAHTGIPCVYKHPYGGFHVRMYSNGGNRRLGRYATIEEARAVVESFHRQAMQVVLPTKAEIDVAALSDSERGLLVEILSVQKIDNAEELRIVVNASPAVPAASALLQRVIRNKELWPRRQRMRPPLQRVPARCVIIRRAILAILLHPGGLEKSTSAIAELVGCANGTASLHRRWLEKRSKIPTIDYRIVHQTRGTTYIYQMAAANKRASRVDGSK